MIAEGRKRGGIREVKLEVAELLDSGYALTHNDIRGMFSDRGMSPNSVSNLVAIDQRRFEEETGVPAKKISYRGRVIIVDARLIPELDTDILEVKREINEDMRRNDKRLKRYS